MALIEMTVAGSGGLSVFINPAHVVCVLHSGPNRSQIVTTGLSSEASMSIVVDMAPDLAVKMLSDRRT